MLPIESSTSEPNTPPPATSEQEKPAAQDAENKRLSRIYIATILAAGLLIAAGYVGSRVFASRSHPPAPRPETTSNRPAPAVTAPSEEKAKTGEKAKNPAPPAETPAPDPKSSSAQAPAVAPSAHESTSADDEGLATPQHGERYLQVAALSASTVQKYVSQLRNSQLEAVAARGPRPGITRVLVGPFSDRESLESVRARLLTMGVSPFVRSY